MKRILFMLCIASAVASCKSAHDKMISKIEATDKLLMADTLLRNDSLAAQQYNNLSEFAIKFPKDTMTPAFLFKSADLSSRLRRTTQAFMTYKRLNDSFPDTKEGTDALFMMAFLYENNFKNYPKAKEYYAAFIAKYPGNPLVKDAQASLGMLNSGKSLEEMVKEWEARADSSKK